MCLASLRLQRERPALQQALISPKISAFPRQPNVVFALFGTHEDSKVFMCSLLLLF